MKVDIQATQKKLNQAAVALEFLEHAGVIVEAVEVTHRNTVIKVARPPESRLLFIKGVFKKRDFVDGHQIYTYAATAFGCQVEWIEVIGVPVNFANAKG